MTGKTRSPGSRITVRFAQGVGIAIGRRVRVNQPDLREVLHAKPGLPQLHTSQQVDCFFRAKRATGPEKWVKPAALQKDRPAKK